MGEQIIIMREFNINNATHMKESYSKLFNSLDKQITPFPVAPLSNEDNIINVRSCQFSRMEERQISTVIIHKYLGAWYVMFSEALCNMFGSYRDIVSYVVALQISSDPESWHDRFSFIYRIVLNMLYHFQFMTVSPFQDCRSSKTFLGHFQAEEVHRALSYEYIAWFHI